MCIRDSVVSNSNPDTVSVLANDGFGRFAPKVDFVAGRAPLVVVLGDVDGDGKSDLALANISSHTDTYTVSVFLNRSPGCVVDP